MPGPAPTPRAIGHSLASRLDQGVVTRVVAGLVLASVALYYLATGRERNEPGRLAWAAVFGLLALLVLSV
ncbi:MAG: hypothetical protein KGL53_14865 [Elusimicrobia bacterium]|nr:hypothetical protein [Elusimicrobiota bacterium]